MMVLAKRYPIPCIHSLEPLKESQRKPLKLSKHCAMALGFKLKLKKSLPAIDETLIMADFFLNLCFLSWKIGM